MNGPIFQLTVGSSPITAVVLDGANTSDESLSLGELQYCGFEVLNVEATSEYRLWVGDEEPLTQSWGMRYGNRDIWQDHCYFESSRGLVSVFLRSRTRQSDDQWQERAAIVLNVVPEKLGEARYIAMFEELRSLSIGLVFDLVSKTHRSVRTVGIKGVSIRPPHIELLALEELWERLSLVLLRMSLQPASRLRSHTELRALWGGERLDPTTLTRLAAAGIDPRDARNPRPLKAVERRLRETFDTFEHRVIRGFLEYIGQRVRECQRSAIEHMKAIEAERMHRDVRLSIGPTIYESFDLPRVRRLEDACERANSLLRRILNAGQLPFLQNVRPELAEPRSAVFDNVMPYHYFRRLMLSCLGRSLIVLDVQGEERIKSTSRMYEQWVFLQVAAAIRSFGLATKTDHDFLKPLGRRFVIDIDRGARIVFESNNGREIHLRYEPYIFPSPVAKKRADSVYRGIYGDTPWAPDVLIEFFTLDSDGTSALDYAVVLDAKYSREISSKHWSQTDKYSEIRSTQSGRQVVKQVWLVHPASDEITCRDSAVQWTEFGPTATRDEVVYGSVGMLPPEYGPADSATSADSQVTDSAHAFVTGILSFVGFHVEEHV
jgi:hypothetical protein